MNARCVAELGLPDAHKKTAAIGQQRRMLWFALSADFSGVSAFVEGLSFR